MPRIAVSKGHRSLARFAALAVGVLLGAATFAQITSLYYQEVAKDRHIYVFNTADRYRVFLATGEAGPAITLPGRGPAGETVVAENETALDLFLFKHNLPAYERPAARPTPAPAYPQIKLGGTGFISYQGGKSSGSDYSKFVIKRAYLNLTAQISPYFWTRITPDVTQDATTGETKYRLKYAYGSFSLPQLGFLTRPFVSFGMVQTPWFDFEEKINRYRMQDTLFLERAGLIASADVGVALGGLLGGEMSADYQNTVSSAFPGRYGSVLVGIYNGGGYTASEQNTNKPLEGRLSLRPLPDLVPGFQVSYFGVVGKGNTAAAPDWSLSSGTLSFESRWVNAATTLVTGRGNLAGNAVSTHGAPLDRDGWSAFAEGKPMSAWSVIGRYDYFKADKTTPSSVTKRAIVGVGYHMGRGNDLLLDYDRLRYENAAKPTDSRAQLTLQFNF